MVAQTFATRLLFVVEFSPVVVEYAQSAGASVNVGAGGVNIGFSRVSGIESELTMREYVEGTSPRSLRVPVGKTASPCTLSKAVTGIAEYSILLGWYERCSQSALGEFVGGDSVSNDFLPVDDVRISIPFEHRHALESGAKINLAGFSSSQKVQVILRNAWPFKLKFGDLDSSSSEVLISELTLQYDDFDVITGAFNLDLT
jgi:phage tail-like protein